jgi:hypothetical protein
MGWMENSARSPLTPIPHALRAGEAICPSIDSAAMTETYTSGAWIVKPGEEEAFVQEWTSFVTWASSMPGSGTFRLVCDLDDPSHYMSFAP